MKKGFPFALFLLMFMIMNMHFVQAQRVLYLKKYDAKRKYQYKEGERLKLKLKDSGEVLIGSWYYAGEYKILLAGQEVALDNIHWVDVSVKENGIYLLRKGQDLLILGGLGYFVVSQLNNLIAPGEYSLDKQDLRVSSLLVGGGLLCTGADRLFRKRKVRIGSRFRIYLME